MNQTLVILLLGFINIVLTFWLIYIYSKLGYVRQRYVKPKGSEEAVDETLKKYRSKLILAKEANDQKNREIKNLKKELNIYQLINDERVVFHDLVSRSRWLESSKRQECISKMISLNAKIEHKTDELKGSLDKFRKVQLREDLKSLESEKATIQETFNRLSEFEEVTRNRLKARKIMEAKRKRHPNPPPGF